MITDLLIVHLIIAIAGLTIVLMALPTIIDKKRKK